MERTCWLAVFIVLLGSVVGCGDSTGDTPNAEAGGSENSATASGPTTPSSLNHDRLSSTNPAAGCAGAQPLGGAGRGAGHLDAVGCRVHQAVGGGRGPGASSLVLPLGVPDRHVRRYGRCLGYARPIWSRSWGSSNLRGTLRIRNSAGECCGLFAAWFCLAPFGEHGNHSAGGPASSDEGLCILDGALAVVSLDEDRIDGLVI